MKDVQLFGGLIIMGVLIFSAVTHGIVFYRVRQHRVHGVFALLCLLLAIYTLSNIAALFLVSKLDAYAAVSKLSSVAVILAVMVMSWFAAEFLQESRNIPLKLIAIMLAPFFILNLFMSNGILWSSIDGIAITARPLGNEVLTPVNAVVSWPMYGLWLVITIVYFFLIRAAYVSWHQTKQIRGKFLLITLVVLTTGFVFDVLIDLGLNKSYFYVSEYMMLAFVVLMSLRLSDELRMHELNLEKMVSERTQALQQLNDELKSFSYSVSHDLRFPLRTASGFATILKEDYSASLDKDAHRLIDKVVASVQRMQEMIDGLLALSNVSVNEITRSDVDMSSVAHSIVEELRQNEPNRQIKITIEEGLHCLCDPIMAQNLLVNLFENAWKYTRNTDNPEISMRHFVSDTGKKGILIQDNGAGFNSDYAHKLFLPFQRLHNDKEFPGLGIGLATVASIVKRHGGEIWAESQKGNGATFFFIL